MPCRLSGHFGGTPATPEPTPPLFIHHRQTSPSQHRQPGPSRSPCLFLPALPASEDATGAACPACPGAASPPPPGKPLCSRAIPGAIGPIPGATRLERGAGRAGTEEEAAWAAQHQLPGHHPVPAPSRGRQSRSPAHACYISACRNQRCFAKEVPRGAARAGKGARVGRGHWAQLCHPGAGQRGGRDGNVATDSNSTTLR